jgi:hypothetical protein
VFLGLQRDADRQNWGGKRRAWKKPVFFVQSRGTERFKVFVARTLFCDSLANPILQWSFQKVLAFPVTLRETFLFCYYLYPGQLKSSVPIGLLV